ncbi:MAG: hypothetical protein JO011_19675 [Ktedonobacteraceae bacterium]|nr:hypothetical protein [Ktedonobacteraceae bacterium]
MENQNVPDDRTMPLEALNQEPTLPAIPTSSPTPEKSRRKLLQGVLAGAAGLSVTSVAGLALASNGLGGLHIQNQSTTSDIKTFFSILATGEALAQTFYSQAIAHQEDLELTREALFTLQAIRAEEQLHFSLAVSQGGVPATTHFSFPYGKATFRDGALFLKTQQQIEELTSGALLAWIKDTASMGQPRLAQLGGQLMQVEGGHRVLGRVFRDTNPFANWGFAPVVVAHFTDVPSVVKAAGFLSPKQGNDFELRQIDPRFPGLIDTTPGTL